MRKLTLLVVDDDEVIRMVFGRPVARALARQDIELVLLEAEDGEAGLAMLLAHLGEIDLVISDCDMPRMGGLQFYEKAAPSLGATPFWLMSGIPRPVPKGVRFLEKPLDVAILANDIAAFVATGADEEDLDPPVPIPMP